MQWLLSGGEVLAGIVALVLLWLALKVAGGNPDKPLTNMRFAVLPAIFLLWATGGFILILRGAGVL
jgi:hypothetical protein